MLETEPCDRLADRPTPSDRPGMGRKRPDRPTHSGALRHDKFKINFAPPPPPAPGLAGRHHHQGRRDLRVREWGSRRRPSHVEDLGGDLGG